MFVNWNRQGGISRVKRFFLHKRMIGKFPPMQYSYWSKFLTINKIIPKNGMVETRNSFVGKF